jgi:PAS domain S-box-containing protein
VSDQVPRALTTNLPGVVYRCAGDADWTIEFLSDGILALTGHPAQDFVGKSVRSYDRIIHPDDQVMVREAAQAAMERSEPFQVTYRIVTAAGDIRWVWEQGVGVVDDSGSVALEGFITDVTDRVRTEQELHGAKSRLEQLIGSMTEGVSELDAEGVHVDVNAAFTAMTGFSRDELVGVGPPHPYWPPEEIAAIDETFAHAIVGEGHSFELTFMRKNGERFPVVVSPFVVRDETGSIVTFSATFRDITGQRAAEEATRQRVREGEKLVEAGLALIACHTKDEVFDVITRHLADMLPDAVTLVNRCPVDPRHIVVHSVTGMDSSMLVRAAELVGFDIVGKTAVVAERDLGRTFVRSLQQFDGGFEAYVAGNAPRSAAKLVKKLLGFHDVYIIGITDGTTVFGNVSVLTREPGAVLPARAIESFVQQVFLTLARIRTSRRLAESEEKYRMLAEGMADMVWTLDPETLRFTYVSPSVQRLRGYTPEEVLAEPLDAALTPEGAAYLTALNRTRAADRVAGRITDSTFFSEEVQQPCKDGSLIWTESVTSYCLDERTGRVEVRGVTRDITERRLAEETLRQNERWLSESQRVAALGHYIFDIGQDYWDGSPALHDVLGTSDGRGGDFAAWLQIVHPDDRERLSRYFSETVLGQKRPFDIEYRIVRPRDGVERWVHGLGTVAFAEDGRPLEMFGIIQDVTERKLVEKALRTSEEGFRALFESAADGIFMLSETGTVVSVNASMAKMHGYEVDEMASMELSDLDTPEVSLLAPGRMRRILAGESLTFEVEHYRKDGTTIPLEVVTSLVTIGGRKYVLGFHRDIRERRAVEAELTAHRQHLEALVEDRTANLAAANDELMLANEELRVATAAKSAFLAAMSHELRTPLNSIIGFSGILAQGLAGPMTGEQFTQVEMINRSGRHLLSLIDGVLDLAKVEAGRIGTVVEPVDPIALAREVAEVVHPLAADKGLYLEVDDATFDGTLRSDEGKLRQILFNLVGNAVKFTDRGGIRIAVRGATGDVCEMSVTDTGCGIDATDLPRIFEPFTQLDSPALAKPKGTGLGLRIAREYAHLLGGDITVVSEPGVGSTFTLRLPIEPPAAE